MNQATKTIDPVTLEVIANALPAISNEMTTVVQQSAYSQFIYEVKDFCTAIFDTSGRAISQGIGGVSMFLADLGVVVRDGIERFGIGNFAPGDVMIINHPRVLGQHLNHICIYTPFFLDGELTAFPLVNAHHLDIGGSPGGMTVDPWMEGLQIDQLKLYDGGRPDETAFQLIRDNVRLPHATLGDIRAQIAACRLAERRLTELFGRYGRSTVLDGLETVYDHSEARCRAAVEKIPDGEYEAESWMDNDRVNLDERVRLHVKVIVSGSDMTIDLTGCSAQTRGMMNCRSLAGAYVAYKALTTPFEPVNAGSFRPLKVEIQERNLMMATYPAAVQSWSSMLASVVDCVFAALAPALPDKMPAGSQGITAGCGFAFTGSYPGTNQPFRCNDGQGAGWGARPFEDGVSAMCAITQGDVRNSPVEAIENRYPIVRILRRGLALDSGGAGRFRGGLGLHLEATNLVDLYWQHSWSGRVRFPPQGLRGGKPGKVVRFYLREPGSSEWQEESVFKRLYWSQAGSAMRQLSSGGGGWGDPLDRDPERVQSDVIDGYVSAVAAREEYGVVLDEALEVDLERTASLRAEMRDAGA